MNACDPRAGRVRPGGLPPGPSDAPLLRVKGLNVDLLTTSGTRNVVHNLNFEARAGETLALVGESGGGKSVACLAITGLLAKEARISGSIQFAGRELSGLGRAALENVRGAGIGMVFQDASTALNPVRSIGSQLVETLVRHMGRRGDHRRAALDLLADVGLPDPPRLMRAYPHELSGGQGQRAMIAMALAAAPRLLIADEPTSALDVTIQAQILDLLAALSRDRGMGLLVVTHDLGVVAQYADRVAVLYAGTIVETATTIGFFERPSHPYSRRLVAAVPRIDQATELLATIPGTVPPPGMRPPGCSFGPRCQFAIDLCHKAAPPSIDLTPDHSAACFRLDDGEIVHA